MRPPTALGRLLLPARLDSLTAEGAEVNGHQFKDGPAVGLRPVQEQVHAAGRGRGNAPRPEADEAPPPAAHFRAAEADGPLPVNRRTVAARTGGVEQAHGIPLRLMASL